MNRIITILLLLCAVAVANAQQGFGTNTPDPSAVVDMTATNKGVLIPRTLLLDIGNIFPMTSPAINLLIFNYSTFPGVTTGFYYWNGTVWMRILNKGDNSGSAWSLTGNAGTTSGTNFLGTTDAKDLTINTGNTGNTERIRVTSAGSVGIGTNSPATPALLDVSSTTQGFLPPRMTATQIAAIANPTEGLIVYNTTQQCLAYYSKGTFTCGFTAPFICGRTMTITHTAGTVAPVTKTVTYGTVNTNLTGSYKCWITQNLGADNQATSATDATEPSAGWYWQFNRAQGYKHDGTTRTPGGTWDATADNTSATWESAKDPCTQLLGPGWRIPTPTEWTDADSNGAWSSYTDTYNSVLKLHAAGVLQNTDGTLNLRSIVAHIWGSTQTNATIGSNLYISNASVNISGSDKTYGFNVRCLIDMPDIILNCGSVVNTGTLVQGTAASGVTSVIQYTAGNGGAYGIQNVASTGVTGLTATLNAGYFATGSGTLTYTITGTPAGNGTASFAISIGGQNCTITHTVSPITIPANIILGQSQSYMVASIYDKDYLPYTTPTVAATTGALAADGTDEGTVIDVQGTLSTTGIPVSIPVTATGSGTLGAYTNTVTIPAAMTQDGISRDVILSWTSQGYTSATKSITATIAAVGGPLNAKKLDINAGVGNDNLGVLMGIITYPYNNAGNTTNYSLRNIAGIPDKMFGQADNGAVVRHNFLYLPVTGEDGNIWLNNNLGADYSNTSSGSFNPAQQATAYNDYHAYGSLIQWGRKPDGHELINWTDATTGTVVNGTTGTTSDAPVDALFITNSTVPKDWRVTPNDALWATEASGNNPCPGGFRVPTLTEQSALVTAAGITNYTTAAASKLKFSVPGGRIYTNGTLNDAGSYSYYWSSSVSGTYASNRYFTSSSTATGTSNRANGMTVRCIIDVPAILNCGGITNNGTLVQGTAASGVTSVIPYTAGNGGAYATQNVASTGVTGLIATLNAGNFATGSGTLTYTITGTPVGNGTASFAISIGGQNCTITRTVSPITIPANIILGQSQSYMVASVYDNNYLPYTMPTVAATTIALAPDGTTESPVIDVQGTLTTTGVTIRIPVTATGSGTLGAYTNTVTIPAAITQDGISRDVILSWASQDYTSATKSITATIAAVGGNLNAKKLDVNAGVGNDNLGVLMGTITYPYNNAGATTGYSLRDIAGIPDKMFGQVDNGGVVRHNFLYVPLTGEDGNIWLNNNLGADYSNTSSASFNPAQQATAYNDYHAYGSLIQWGREPDGHELINWTGSTTGTAVNGTTATLSDAPTDALFITNGSSPYDWRVTPNDALWATEASANNPCPGGFRVPTLTEQSALVTAAGITNYTDAASSKLKLSVPGARGYNNGTLYNATTNSYYWSSSVSGTSASFRYFNSSATGTGTNVRTYGYTVRCLKD